MSTPETDARSGTLHDVVTTEVKPPRSGFATFLLVVCAMAFVTAALVRLLGIDGTRYMIAATSLTPYITVVGLLIGLFALFRKRWVIGLTMTLVGVVLVANVAPRAFSDARPNGVGQQVRLMTSNLLTGIADAQFIVQEVRKRNIDILAMQELTPQMVGDLDRAGLRQVLPNRVFLDEPGGSGSGLASRFPLSRRDLTPPGTLQQAGALVDLPGKDIEVVSVHPLPPVVTAGPEAWQRELAGLPAPDSTGAIRVLAGDFNATLDHVGLTRLLNKGYVDAADQVGKGLIHTWPSDSGFWPPPVTIDHVLVDSKVLVDTVDVFDVPGSDHRAVVTQFVVPRF
ncbi:endonuclease/exonuclease/phosphatase family protein [Lentzea sp. BCCO 10_0798]|uniref:Endonuclease/exonuclease/phosphatase family protein n=1 Tax=Lentzea kristufekii TaxID=3095430 RepID=A0ABU4TSW1_9PSEU|nr:endonuclease/exonuclease/phosphatase family protein [Lentzea sp. BCCO 10_0798]MDX8051365.1 endonuclease/exonuclease/phosphatase family protein [Lentzea sp. BCCO 10_0798]